MHTLYIWIQLVIFQRKHLKGKGIVNGIHEFVSIKKVRKLYNICGKKYLMQLHKIAVSHEPPSGTETRKIYSCPPKKYLMRLLRWINKKRHDSLPWTNNSQPVRSRNSRWARKCLSSGECRPCGGILRFDWSSRWKPLYVFTGRRQRKMRGKKRGT